MTDNGTYSFGVTNMHGYVLFPCPSAESDNHAFEWRSAGVTLNFSAYVNQLWIRPPEDKWRSIWPWLFASSSHIDSMWSKRHLTHGAKNSAPHKNWIKQAGRWVRHRCRAAQAMWRSPNSHQLHSQLKDNRCMGEETLTKWVQDSPVPHLRVLLLKMIAAKYYWSQTLI